MNCENELLAPILRLRLRTYSPLTKRDIIYLGSKRRIFLIYQYMYETEFETLVSAQK